jgi:hypothetical protein
MDPLQSADQHQRLAQNPQEAHHDMGDGGDGVIL